MHVYTGTHPYFLYYLYNLFMVYRYTYIIVVPRGVYYPVLYCVHGSTYTGYDTHTCQYNIDLCNCNRVYICNV
jgi:hypothetical protein